VVIMVVVIMVIIMVVIIMVVIIMVVIIMVVIVMVVIMAVLVMVIVPVVASRHVHEPPRHAAALDPFEAGTGRTGTVPAIGSPAPVPAIVEEDFLVKAFHHLDAGLDYHEPRGDGQAEFDADAHLGPSRDGARRQQGCEGNDENSHGWFSWTLPRDTRVDLMYMRRRPLCIPSTAPPLRLPPGTAAARPGIPGGACAIIIIGSFA
jgi:hypothetical protein